MGEFDMKREFWQKSQNEEKKDVEKWQPLDVDECTWSLDDGFERDSGDPCKTLMILLQKPDPTHERMSFNEENVRIIETSINTMNATAPVSSAMTAISIPWKFCYKRLFSSIQVQPGINQRPQKHINRRT